MKRENIVKGMSNKTKQGSNTMSEKYSQKVI